MSQSRTPNLEGGQAPDAGAQPIVTHLAWVTLPGPSSTTASAASSSPTLISPASLPCSSPSASHSAEHGDATPRGRLPAADAQPNGRSSLRAKDHSPPTSGDIQPGMMRDRGDGTTVEAGLTMEEATIFDQCEAQDRVTRAHAGQPAAKLTALTATSLLPRDAEGCPTVSYPAAMDEGVFTRRSSVETLVVGWGRSLDGDPSLDELPNEVLMHILSYLEVCELLDVSRTNHHFRTLCLHPFIHNLRLRRARLSLPPLLSSPSRPTLRDLIANRIFLTHTTQVSRRLARNLVAIRLSRRLPLRPSAETLVNRGVLPSECVEGSVAPGLVAKKRAVERERLKDGLRRWVGAVWRGEVNERSEGVKQREERAGVGRVWKLRRFWEHIGKADGKGVR